MKSISLGNTLVYIFQDINNKQYLMKLGETLSQPCHGSVLLFQSSHCGSDTIGI